MISVIEVFNSVRDLCNKDQKGFVTPRVFNSFSEIAQQNIYSEMFKELIAGKQLRRQQLDPAAQNSSFRGKQDDLSTYVYEADLELVDSSALGVDSNIFRKPEDISRIISIRVDNDDRTPVELAYDVEKISHILSSNLSAPTESYPVALISGNIEVFPTVVEDFIITYYRQPASLYITNLGGFIRGDVDVNSSPRIVVEGVIDGEGFFVPQVDESRDFELPEHYKGELVSEIAKLIGLRLRDEFLLTHTTNETNIN